MKENDAEKMWSDLAQLTREQVYKVWKIRNKNQIEWEVRHNITFRKKQVMKARNIAVNRNK
jgi:hypothetical protein